MNRVKLALLVAIFAFSLAFSQGVIEPNTSDFVASTPEPLRQMLDVKSCSNDNLERERLALEREKLLLEKHRLDFEIEKWGCERRRSPCAESYVYVDEYRNFTAGQRWRAFSLNLLFPGLGSWTIMGDVKGGFIHFGTGAVAAFGWINYLGSEKCSTNSSYTTCNYDDKWIIFNVVSTVGNITWNIYRSVSYNKPGKVALLEPSNFRLAAVPNENGKSIMPGLFYNVRF